VYSVPYFVMFKIQNKSIYDKCVGEKICFFCLLFKIVVLF